MVLDSALAAPPHVDGPRAEPGSPHGFRCADGVEFIGEYQDSGLETPRYLVRRADGQLMQLPGLLYRVASSLDGRSAQEIAADLSVELDQPLTGEDVTYLVEDRLRPAGLVAVERNPTAAVEEQAPPVLPASSDPLLALTHRAGVLPPAVVWRIAGFFRPLFFRPVWLANLCLFAALTGWTVARAGFGRDLLAGVQTLAAQPALILAVFGLVVASGAFHECGHVAACRYGGAVPGVVGVGLYLVWPAFYSTVTDSYRLGRTGRLRTDLGGVYFNVVLLNACIAVYALTGQAWLLIATAMMLYQTLYQFLPTIRFDGYYVLADLVGVPELFSYVGPVLRRFLRRDQGSQVSALRPGARRVIVLWVAVVVPALAVSLVLFVVAIPWVLPVLLDALSAQLDALSAAAHAGQVVIAALIVVQLIFLVLPWVGTGLLLWSLLRTVAKWVLPRTALRRVPATAWARARRLAPVGLVAATGLGLVLRVAAVSATTPGGAAEGTLAQAAFARVRDLPWSGSVPPVEWLAQQQLVGWARLTGAFDRHTDVLVAGRELGVVATAALVACLLALVLLRRVSPLAVGLPLAAVLVMGPAVTLLGSVSAVPLACAWLALGVLLVGTAGSRTSTVLGTLAVLLGVATAPLVIAPLAVLSDATVRAGRPGRALPWWPEPIPAGGRAVAPAAGTARHRAAAPARVASVASWSVLVGMLLVGSLAILLSARGASAPLPSADRTALLMAVSAVALGGVLVRRLRPVGVAVTVVTILAIFPWGGSGSALVLALLCALLLAVLLVDAAVRPPVAERAHPLLRTGLALPAGIAVLVAALLLPPVGVRPAHAELAAWLRTPGTSTGTVVVPAALRSDLVRDGIPAARLVTPGSPTAPQADWSVVLGAPAPTAGGSTVLGSGPAALTVSRTPAALARLRAEEQAQAALTEAAEQRARTADGPTRQALGSLLARSPHVTGAPDVMAALAGGTVDQRALTALAGIAADHAVALAPLPAPSPGGTVQTLVFSGLDGRQTSVRDVASGLLRLLQAQPAGLAPDQVDAGPGGVSATWAPGTGQ